MTANYAILTPEHHKNNSGTCIVLIPANVSRTSSLTIGIDETH